MSPEIPLQRHLEFQNDAAWQHARPLLMCGNEKSQEMPGKYHQVMALKNIFPNHKPVVYGGFGGVVGRVPRVCWSFLRSFGFGRRGQQNLAIHFERNLFKK